MNKRITSILLCFIMVFSMLVSAVPVYAAPYESTQLKVIPDKTTANPGDIITYTIIMGPVSDMGSMQMVLDIPTGLTYVENSGKLADGLRTTLGFDTADWTEASKRTDPLYPGSMINGMASAADYKCETDTTLATFQCKVNNDFTGTVSVGLVKLEFGSCQTFENHTTRFSVVPTAVTVAAAPVAVTGVTIDETLSVDIGQTKTPSYTVAPAEATNKTVSFTSDNPAVATVNATTGEVTGVKEGTATITVKTADGNFTDTCTVTVSEIPKQELTFTNNGPVQRTYGDEAFTNEAINNTSGGGGTLTYTSSDDNVATVDSTGKVTIKKAGTVEITATAAAVPGFAETKAKYTLNIDKKELTITNATVTAKKYNGDATAEVTAVTMAGTVGSETLTKGTDYTVAGKFNSPNVSDANTVTVTVTLKDTELANNYKIAGTFDKAATIDKADGADAPTVTGSYAVSTTDESKFAYTVTPIDGAEYSDNGTTYQDSNVFDNIAPESTVTFYARIKGTDNVKVGAAGDTGVVTFNKLNNAKVPDLVYQVTGTSGNRKITVTPVTGAEYSFDGGATWSDTNVKDGIKDATVNVQIRYKETATLKASAPATASVNTAKKTQIVSFAEPEVNKKYSDADFVITAVNNKNDGGAIKYSSSDSNVAVVNADNGKVTIKGNGTATIKAKALENETYAQSAEAQYILKVAKGTITITAKNKTAYVGDTAPVLGTSDYTVTGLRDGEKLATLPTIAYESTPDMTAAGTATIKVSGAAAPAGDNYNEIVYQNGTLTIAKKSSSGGGYIPTIQKPTIEAGEGVKVTLSTDGTVATITVDPAYEIADVVLNGTSKGKVTEVKGLKTGDKLVVTATKKATEPTKEDILATLADQKLVARSKVVTMKNGKKAVRITWYNQNGEMMEFDGVEIFRSTKRYSGYGKKPIFTSETGKYYNTAIKAGTKYYYKVRGFVVIDGQKYYTDWSLKAWRTVK